VRDLGDVLELLHTSAERWNSLRLAGTEWRHLARFNQAWERWVEATQRNSRIASVMSFAPVLDQAESREPPETTAEPWRLWKAKPNKIRTQFQVGSGTVTAVFAGRQWWSWMLGMGFLTNTGDLNSSHGLGPAEVLVDTPSLLSHLKLQAVSRVTLLSRSAYRVVAEPATVDQGPVPRVLHALGAGADRYELVVDAEVGLVLRSQAELGGETFRILEVEELGINEALDERLFSSDNLRG
jgi:hypothetical protein